MTRLDPTEDTGYIVGRPFKTGEGWAWPGEPAPEEAVTSTNLYALISAGFLYPFVPDEGYAKLPPHVYSAVRTYQEVHDIITRGEAPITMDWTPPKKLQEAIDQKDAEELSKLASQTASPATSEDWTRKLEVNQISPRPIELPREELFTDSKKDEAAAVADDEEAAREGDEDAPVDEGDDRDQERRENAEKAFEDLTPTPQFGASEDNPLRPEFTGDDSDLQDTFEEVQAVTESKDKLDINTEDVSVLERQDSFEKPVFDAPELQSEQDKQDYADELREESTKVAEEQAEETESVADPDIESEPLDLENPAPVGAEEPGEVETDDTPTEPFPAEDEANEGSTYAAFSKDELIAEAKGRGLSTAGTKADLVARLEEDDSTD